VRHFGLWFFVRETPIVDAPSAVNGAGARAPVTFEFSPSAQPVAEASAAPAAPVSAAPPEPFFGAGAGSISLSFSHDEPLEAALEKAAPEPEPLVAPSPAHDVPEDHAQESLSAEHPVQGADAQNDEDADAAAVAKARAWKDSLTWQEQEALRSAEKTGNEKEGVVGFLLRTLGVR
jgi:hypothetical protein